MKKRIPGINTEALPSDYAVSKPLRVSAPPQAIEWWASLSAQERGRLIVEMRSEYLQSLDRKARLLEKI